MMMLAPDLLDRRALALLALTDPVGRPIEGMVSVTAPGVRHCLKSGGRLAILDAPGLAAHGAAFAAPPSSPALRSRSVALDLAPADPRFLPRRVTLRLPRDAEPANRGSANSLFVAQPVIFSPSPQTQLSGTACIVRVSVTRSGDGARVGQALVRGRTANGSQTAWAQTDDAGEAALVFAAMPLAFARPGGGVAPDIEASVVVHADPAVARFAVAASSAVPRAPAAPPFLDPDLLAAAMAPAFAGGATVRLAANRQLALALTWTAP